MSPLLCSAGVSIYILISNDTAAAVGLLRALNPGWGLRDPCLVGHDASNRFISPLISRTEPWCTMMVGPLGLDGFRVTLAG